MGLKSHFTKQKRDWVSMDASRKVAKKCMNTLENGNVN